MKPCGPALVDGILYPGERSELNSFIDKLLLENPSPHRGASGIIVPHGWYELCGPVMARAYSALNRQSVPDNEAGRSAEAVGGDGPAAPPAGIERIIILAPVHREFGPHLFLPEFDCFATPLGSVGIDREIKADLLRDNPMFEEDNTPYKEEHCIEVQLPFLQHLFPGVPVVPIFLGESSRKVAIACAKSLNAVLSLNIPKTLFVATTNSADSPLPESAEEAADRFNELVEKAAWKDILLPEHRRRISACCPGAVSVLFHPAIGFTGADLTGRSGSHRDAGPAKGTVIYSSYIVKRGIDP